MLAIRTRLTKPTSFQAFDYNAFNNVVDELSNSQEIDIVNMKDSYIRSLMSSFVVYVM